MIRRWVGLGVVRAAARLRRIKGHGDLAALATALRLARRLRRARRVIIAVRARRAATSRPALAPGTILRRGTAMSVSPHDCART